MRQRILSAFCLLIMYLLLPVLSVLMIYHMNTSEILSNMDSGGFGREYSMFAVTSPGNAPSNVYTAIGSLDGSYALYGDSVLSENMTVRYLYFNDTYVTLSMKWGRFFRASDFDTQHPYAVIGKGLANQLYTKNSTPYLSVNNIEYQVIGMIEYPCQTTFDQYVFINGFASGDVSVTSYTIDFFKTKDAEKTLVTAVNRLNRQGFDASVRTIDQRFIHSLLPKILYGRWFLLVLLCNLICIILLSMEWINTWKTEIAIRQLSGGENSSIARYILGKYSVFYIVSLLVGTGYTFLFYRNYLGYLLIAYLGLLGVLLLIFIVQLVKQLHSPISKEVY